MAGSCRPTDQKHSDLNVKTRASLAGSFNLLVMVSASSSSSNVRRYSPSGDSEVRKLNSRSNTSFITALLCERSSIAFNPEENFPKASPWEELSADFRRAGCTQLTDFTP